jgi:WG containing repeat
MRCPRHVLAVLLLFLTLVTSSHTCEWDYLIWIPHSENADPLYRFIRDGKAGYIDKTGKIVVPPTLELYGNSAGEFHDGLIEVGASDGEYVDQHGRVPFIKKFYRGWSFSDGLAVAMETQGEKWGYINTKGEFAISPRFASSPTDYAWPFENGFAKIKVAGRFGYIDHTGSFVIPPRLLDGDSFHEGYARVVVEGPCVKMESVPCSSPEVLGVATPDTDSRSSLPGCKFTFVDTAGQIISDLRFESAKQFSEGLAPVQVGGLWGYIDTSGKMVIPPRFESAAPFSGGLGLVSSNHLFGYIDQVGSFVIQPQFKSADSFADGLALIGDEESGYFYINKSGQQAFSGKFLIASSFFKGLAHVKVSQKSLGEDSLEETFAYINSAGEPVFTYTYKVD